MNFELNTWEPGSSLKNQSLEFLKLKKSVGEKSNDGDWREIYCKLLLARNPTIAVGEKLTAKLFGEKSNDGGWREIDCKIVWREIQ